MDNNNPSDHPERRQNRGEGYTEEQLDFLDDMKDKLAGTIKVPQDFLIDYEQVDYEQVDEDMQKLRRQFGESVHIDLGLDEIPDEIETTQFTPIHDYDDEEITDEVDLVNHPSHYCNRKMEAIDIIEMIIEIEKNPKVAYNFSNVLKYLLRFRDKGIPIRDLQKCGWYLNRMIMHVEKESK